MLPILSLRELGFTQAEIARTVGTHSTTASDQIHH